MILHHQPTQERILRLSNHSFYRVNTEYTGVRVLSSTTVSEEIHSYEQAWNQINLQLFNQEMLVIGTGESMRSSLIEQALLASVDLQLKIDILPLKSAGFTWNILLEDRRNFIGLFIPKDASFSLDSFFQAK